MTRVKLELEYEIKSAPGILYNRLITTGGLAEWFADNVKIDEDIYTFFWENSEEQAKLLVSKDQEFVKYRWLEDDEEDSFFEFRIKIDEMTGDLALVVTDFVDADEVEENSNLWDKQIGKLKMILGS
ncbi:MAG: SRPBCC domain-containing protein [Flavobacteriales bacterium]|nr:SRPBCC domain-containing protein [Flavobacteriales bacterium]